MTKFIRGHDSKTLPFSQTTTTLQIQCCRSSVFRVITSDQLCQVPSILHKNFLCLQQKCHPWCMFIWSLNGFCSNLFPFGGALNSLKWGQNEVVKTASEDLENVTIAFYWSNIDRLLWYFCEILASNLITLPKRGVVCALCLLQRTTFQLF